MKYINWDKLTSLGNPAYKCGYCNNIVSSSVGYRGSSSYNGNAVYSLMICPHCTEPTYFGRDFQFPDALPGNKVESLPSNISSVFNEARIACRANAYTASVLMSRKLLMNIAVGHGAKEGDPFVKYIEFLSNAGYIPPNGKPWVDHIRIKGNEATHEIALKSKEDAEELILFSEMLLKFIYEFPAKIPQPSTMPTTPSTP